MCILALNIVIDKIYLILWFWFLIVGLFGFIRICCRAVQIASAQVIKTNAMSKSMWSKVVWD